MAVVKLYQLLRGLLSIKHRLHFVHQLLGGNLSRKYGLERVLKLRQRDLSDSDRIVDGFKLPKLRCWDVRCYYGHRVMFKLQFRDVSRESGSFGMFGLCCRHLLFVWCQLLHRVHGGNL